MLEKPLLELSDSSKWGLLYQETKAVTYVGTISDGYYIPIPEFDIPFLLVSPILAIKINSTEIKPTWKYGGKVIQKFQLGSSGIGNTLPIAEGKTYSLRLFNAKLCYFPLYVTNYKLAILYPSWFKDATLSIFEYTGKVSDELLDTVKSIAGTGELFGGNIRIVI